MSVTSRDSSTAQGVLTGRTHLAFQAAVFGEIIKHETWPELVRWSSEPALLSVSRFGKHRGERFDAVPIDYLRWIVEGPNDVRSSARYWLEKRLANEVGAEQPPLWACAAVCWARRRRLRPFPFCGRA